MEQVKAFFTNYLLICAVLSWVTAQILKVFVKLFSKEKIELRKCIFASGGMPSSHSASVSSLCVASAIKYGFGSSAFAISLVMAFIVMYDASGVRYETGEQAKILNRITKELFSGKPDEINTGLKEFIGHTPFQVCMGALLGVGIAMFMGFILQVM